MPIHYLYDSAEFYWFIRKARGAVARLVRCVPSNQEGPGSSPVSSIYVLQQDILSALLLSTQVYKWVPGRNGMSAPMWLPCKPWWFLPGMDRCLIDFIQASNDRGNNIAKRLEMIINHIRRYRNRNIIINSYDNHSEICSSPWRFHDDHLIRVRHCCQCCSSDDGTEVAPRRLRRMECFSAEKWYKFDFTGTCL